MPHFVPYKNFMQSILKYKVTSKATNLERQNVNLVLQIFSEYTIQGLLTLGKQKCLPEVAEYINIFYKKKILDFSLYFVMG